MSSLDIAMLIFIGIVLIVSVGSLINILKDDFRGDN